MPTVVVTAPPEAAPALARSLVDERLAASVNRLSCDSVYRWEGEVHEADEELLLIETADERYDELRDRIEALHPYEVPRVERFDATDLLAAFERWRGAATRSDEETQSDEAARSGGDTPSDDASGADDA